MTSNAPSSAPTRFAGLDGLRAVAVALVVLYHLFPPAVLPGGFVGVDVFFVISGFLITSLLLREHDRTGRIRLGAFWMRRLRRLVPALVLVVTVCSTLAWLIGGDVLVRLGAQVLGAATFSYNWLSIAADTGYFGGTTPELFRNFWSLSVEEQFYVVWPLVLPLFLLLPRGAARAVAALALAAASAVWMGAVVSGGGDVTRAYFGTDTHSFGILLGVALAFVLVPVLTLPRNGAATPPSIELPKGWTLALPASALLPARPRWVDARPTRTIIGCLGAAALVGVVLIAATAPSDGTLTFPGTLLAASVCTAVAIAAGVWPGSWFGPALDVQPLRWIGDRSYGIYLWHWPLLVLATAAFPGTGVPVWIGLGVLVLTVVAAELSYRFVETPIRRRGFRACARSLGALALGGPRGRMRVGAVAIVGVLAFGGMTAAIAGEPEESSGEAAVAAGAAALEQATASPVATPSATATPTATPTPAPTASEQPNGPLTTKPSPMPSPTPITGDQISAVGDSVMLASAPALLQTLPGIQVDAEVSRSAWAGPGILERLSSAGALRPYVVVALGTNGPVDPGVLERMAEITGPSRHLVLVNAYAPRDWIPGVNSELAAFAKDHPGVVVADWSTAIGARTDLLAGDSIHPGASGGLVFAETIVRTIETVERDRAQRQYQNELRLYDRLSERPLPVAE